MDKRGRHINEAEMTEEERKADREFLDICTVKELTHEQYRRFMMYREELVMCLIDAVPPGEHPLVIESACLVLAATASVGGLARTLDGFLALAENIYTGVGEDLLLDGKGNN